MRRKFHDGELKGLYPTVCRFCSRKILVGEYGGKWRPYDLVLGSYEDHQSRCRIGKKLKMPESVIAERKIVSEWSKRVDRESPADEAGRG